MAKKKPNYPMNKLATQPLGVTSDSTSGFVPKPLRTNGHSLVFQPIG